MALSNLLIEESEGLLTITMNRADKRNALSLAVMEEMIAVFKDAGQRQDVRAVILAAAGPAFSAGHDIGEMTGKDLSFYRRTFTVCADLMQTIQAIAQPVIAQVAGIATAAGCQLAATCDLVVAGQGARFATPGVRIGLFCSTPMVALSRSIGRKHAMEMLLSGAPIDAATAERWGLVNRVVPDGELASETRKFALAITQASPLVLGIGKQAFYSQIDLDQPKAYDYTKEIMSMNAMAADAQEGMCAFLEKRKPDWQGR